MNERRYRALRALFCALLVLTCAQLVAMESMRRDMRTIKSEIRRQRGHAAPSVDAHRQADGSGAARDLAMKSRTRNVVR